jgi:magnesium transporter
MDLARRPDVTGSSSTPTAAPPTPSTSTRRRKNHRGGKKKKTRRKSFLVPADDETQDGLNSEEGLDGARNAFYSRHDRNLSNTSIDSETLLDHR